MKNKFRPIAMKCNQEQFDSIKPKLEKIGEISGLYGAFKKYHYLTNNFKHESNVFDFIGNNDYKSEHKGNIHETWNQKVFLEACGIEVEESFSVTKEQIDNLCGRNEVIHELMREWFPKAFEEEKKELELGVWYKSKKHPLMIILPTYEDENGELYGYGFDKTGNFILVEKENKNQCLCNSIAKKQLIEATEQEVFEALKKEAVKRGYVDGSYVKPLWATPYESWYLNGDEFLFRDGNLYLSSCIFKEGKWAEIIKTKQMTQSDIEKELGYKIEIV